MSIKTYVLLSSLDSDAPIYQRVVGDQRVKLQKMPFYAVYLRVTFQDKNGVSQTIRYKENATNAEGKNVLNQREQIDKLKIDANEPFTQNERRDRVFRNGILVTNKGILQEYLDIYPGNETFQGFCDDVKVPVYRELNPTEESKIKNNDIRLRVKAANKILELDLEGAQAMLIRLNGSFFETPKDLEECQNLLMEFADDAEEPGLKAILKEDDEMTVDEKTTVLIGKLLSAGTLAFKEGKVSKKINTGEWIELREFSTEYSVEEQKRLFSNFLNTSDGKPLKNDLENDLSELSDDETEEDGETMVAKKRMGRPPKNRV